MQKGDISDGVPPRLLVTYEAVTTAVVEPRKILGLEVGNQTRRSFDRVTLNRLWRYTDRAPLRIELVNYGVTQDEADLRLERLDAIGANSINYSTAYADIDSLLRELPYRPDVMGVLDIPENQARYGLAGVGIDYLDRVL